MGLQDFVENIAVLIDCAPHSVRLATDRDPHFVQIAEITRPGLPATQGAGIGCTKLQAPSTDRLIRDDNTPLEKHLFHKTKAQREAEIQPYRMNDQFARKSVSFVAHA